MELNDFRIIISIRKSEDSHERISTCYDIKLAEHGIHCLHDPEPMAPYICLPHQLSLSDIIERIFCRDTKHNRFVIT